MAIEDRIHRDREARRALIIATARALAESEGWAAVTTRRLSNEIEYSQPVLYKHFPSMDHIIQAVALEGFDELARALAAAREGIADAGEALRRAAHAYHAFAAASPALYDAMFTQSSPLRFGTGDVAAPMTAAFGELRDAVAAAKGQDDVDTVTEVLWAALHGLTTLGRSGRLRLDVEADRIDLLIDWFLAVHDTRREPLG